MNIFVLLFVLLICIILVSSINNDTFKNDTFNNVKTGGRSISNEETYFDRSQVNPNTIRESYEPVNNILYVDFPKNRTF
jgi:hypothetical protein